ncbi:MAG: WbqC family protein [Saprospiraceae bacterium]|nr:WbqC family protein [Saprospiraceae bacterium]
MAPLFPLYYLPPVSWCAAVWKYRQIELEACEHYQKGSLRNRCYIAGPNGIQRLSIPLEKGKHQQMPVRDVRIADTDPWQRQHWRSIVTAYGSAPFFEHYVDGIAPFYEKKYSFLFDFNLKLLEYLFQQKIGWKGAFQLSAQYAPEKMTAPAATSIRYPQVFEERHGFIPDLSVLDLFFCCGNRSAQALADAEE